MLGKWLDLLKEMAPSVRRAALMFNPETVPYYPVWLRELKAAPQPLAAELVAAPVHDEVEIDAAVVALAREPGGGLVCVPDPFTNGHRGLIMTLAKRHRVPAVYPSRQFAAEGGLMSYGPNTYDIFRRLTSYVDRILKGEKPADLPAQAPIKYELVINLATAKALGLTVPPSLLARADEVIE
jgi:putative ABC transport system substrate-binding protein